MNVCSSRKIIKNLKDGPIPSSYSDCLDDKEQIIDIAHQIQPHFTVLFVHSMTAMEA